MTPRSIMSALALSIAGFVVMWAFLSYRYAAADDVPAPGPAVSMLFDAGPVVAAPPPIVAPTPLPDPESFDFLSMVLTAGRTSAPAAAVFLLFGAVTVARRRWPPAREGTTGILTATVLAFLTVVVGSLAMGVPVGQAIGGGLVALLTGRAMAVQPVKAGG